MGSGHGRYTQPKGKGACGVTTTLNKRQAKRVALQLRYASLKSELLMWKQRNTFKNSSTGSKTKFNLKYIFIKN